MELDFYLFGDIQICLNLFRLDLLEFVWIYLEKLL
ncbi:MAG: hypothetical protein HLUCCA11_00130 [Phormidesmis priestleyi Ana]|uniref:Uncharacterized protein n=1 Tax=Phormidesmis priestleyi Ana TaxID=1666911 RepID=A0A0P7ZV06_9CYAN|nr:MAG: hypothetical protein HLUCCA11_00130 [Phormidesmis priestleyi Ana]